MPFTNPLYPDCSRDLSLFCPICSSVSVYYPLQRSLFCTRSRVCEGGIIGIMLRWPSKGCEGETERESRTSSYRSATPHVPSPSFGHGLHSFAWPSHTLFFCGLARAFARLSSNTDKIGTKKVERTETTYREMVQNASACRVKGFLHRSKCGTRVGHAFDA